LAGPGTDLWPCCKVSEFLTPPLESVSICSSLLPKASSSILLRDFSSQAQTHEWQKYVLSRPPTDIEETNTPKQSNFALSI